MRKLAVLVILLMAVPAMGALTPPDRAGMSVISPYGQVEMGGRGDGTGPRCYDSLAPGTAGYYAFTAPQYPMLGWDDYDTISCTQISAVKFVGGVIGAGDYVAGATVELDVTVTVNGLLITRVAEAGAGDLDVYCGYAAGAPVYAGSGSSTLTTGLGATLWVIPKGDIDKDGTVTNLDVMPFRTAWMAPAGTLDWFTTWICDFDGDGAVTNLDVMPFRARWML